MSAESGRRAGPPPERLPGDADEIRLLSVPRLLSEGYQGEVYIADSTVGRVILKRAPDGWPWRSLRRAMLRREYRVYQRLAGIAGVPRCHGLRNRKELVLEFVGGESLRAAHNAPANRPQFYQKLLALIKALHRAGVAHADLKRKENIIVGSAGDPYLIDFGTAVLRPANGGFVGRWLFRQACRMDFNSWVKLKYQGQDDTVTPEDLEIYRPTFAENAARVFRRTWRTLTARQARNARRGPPRP